MRMVVIFIWSHLYCGIEEMGLGNWEEILTKTPADFPHSLAVLILDMEKWLFRLSYYMYLKWGIYQNSIIYISITVDTDKIGEIIYNSYLIIEIYFNFRTFLHFTISWKNVGLGSLFSSGGHWWYLPVAFFSKHFINPSWRITSLWAVWTPARLGNSESPFS